MKYIKTQEEFANEGFDLKKALIGGAIGASIGMSAAHLSDIAGKARKEDTEVVSGQKFEQFEVYVKGKDFYLNISDDGVITGQWTESHGSGKTRTTSTHRCVTVPKETASIWVETKFLDAQGNVFASAKPLRDGRQIRLADLDIKEKARGYTVYSAPMFSDLGYIIVDNGHSEGEEFTVDGKVGKWVCDDLGYRVYIFTVKSLGEGDFGGGGAGEEWDVEKK